MAQAEVKEQEARPQAERRQPLPGITPAARMMDRIWRWVVAIGGIGVILVVLGILIFVLMESYPLFLDPEVRQAGLLDLSAEENALAVGSDPYREIVFAVRTGGMAFFSLADGSPLKQVAPVEGRPIRSVSHSPGDGYLGLGLDEGYAAAVRVNFRVSFDEGERHIEPEADLENQIRLDPAGGRIVRVDYRNDESGRSTFAGVTDSGRLFLAPVRQRRGLLGGGKKEAFVYDVTEDVEGLATVVVVDGRGRYALAGTDRGEVYCWDVSDPEARPRRMQRFQASRGGHAITALDFLIGDVSIVVGDADGRVSTWFAVRQPGGQAYRRFQKIHEFRPHPAPVIAISASQRDKQFLTGDAGGGVMLRHMTSEQTFFHLGGDAQVVDLAFAPKADGFLSLDARGRLVNYDLHNPHPEITLETLFGKVWYEGYTEPDFVWQSSGGSDDFEPKLSIVPLAYGTAKGTFYALLFALPLAVLAAVYTSEFAHPKVRTVVKPTVELMASLPSVILGFLGGLWLAPLLEQEVVGTLLLFPVVPLGVVLAAWIWTRLPRRITSLLPGHEALYVLIPIAALASWLAFALGPGVEGALFGGNFQRWLMETSDTRFDQRNCLVVGFAMGFAVIPIIYTICEDALSSVPSHLRAGSLALGATPWQTAVRVVLPTASPGIFSAAMIGFGRAVGETMIVLMATGNTPIMDWSIFNGMRTLSANIAVEIPEAPHEGTLYRVLFLAGLLLAVVTFLVNTVAEVVRQRLRQRYSRI